MKKIIADLILKTLGWKYIIDGNPDTLNRCILVTVPHTHNMEYFLGNLAFLSMGKKLKIIIKDAHTKAWYGGAVKAIGGIGINREQRNNLVQYVAELFRKEDFALVITPEGTRSRVEKWKKGFYYMAMEAKLPICLAVGDFGTKTMLIGYTIPYETLEKITYEELLKMIQTYLETHNIRPAIPENWNPNIQ